MLKLMAKKIIKNYTPKCLLSWSYRSTLITIHMTIHLRVMIKLNHWVDLKSEVDIVVTSVKILSVRLKYVYFPIGLDRFFMHT